ncbi:DUF1361 domain-containing protein [Bacillus sp. 3255]|uniref:DUF1361 domain-containing protein n=1 Tax=Bacillus sp. 3255 TaxID=2817904 RepID=UPI00285E3D4D|nr:DUF1361 domain-containing protein [Bacillus sp. 3255]MDR6879105.1 putative membrane protein [Bacillus sp. 3255]
MRTLNLWYTQLMLVVLSLVTIAVYLLFKNQTYYEFLLWNLFLGWLPNLFALGAYWVHTGRTTVLEKTLIFLLGLAWLLFLPNAPYILTDFIHLTILKDTYVHNELFLAPYWHDFFIVFLFAWNGFMLGSSSMYMIQTIVRKHIGRAWSWLLVVVVSLLSGYGILLGRQYQLNSWDALMNLRIFEVIRDSLNKEDLLFSALAGLVVLVVYVTFYMLINGVAGSKLQANRR